MAVAAQGGIPFAKYDPPPQGINGSLSFNVHSAVNPDNPNEVTFDPPNSLDSFNQNIRQAEDFGLSFVNLSNAGGKSSFVIMIHLYNTSSNLSNCNVQDFANF